MLQEGSQFGGLVRHYAPATHRNRPFPIFLLIHNPVKGQNASLSEMRNEQPTNEIEKSKQSEQNADKHLATAGSGHSVDRIGHLFSDQRYFEYALPERPERQQTRDAQQEYFEAFPS